jgi:hypothetical protein
VFEQTTRTLHEKRYASEDEFVGSEYHTGDLSDSANQFVWGDISVGELMSLDPSPIVLADSIWGAITAFASIDPIVERAASR